jgi:hypothetical protein
VLSVANCQSCVFSVGYAGKLMLKFHNGPYAFSQNATAGDPYNARWDPNETNPETAGRGRRLSAGYSTSFDQQFPP